MSNHLEREIQRLLDAGESPTEKLAEALEQDPALQRTAHELEQLDALLGEWSAAPLDLDEDVFVRRIAQRLDEQLAPLEHDPTLPPAFDDEDSWRRIEDEHSGEFALTALTDRVSDRVEERAAAPGFAQPPAMEPQPAGKVVRMEPRASSQRWVFAAAAVVGLVAAGGMFFVVSSDGEPSVAMMRAEAPAESYAESEPYAEPYADEAPAPAPAGAAVGSAESTARELAEPADLDPSAALAVAEENEEQVLARAAAGAPSMASVSAALGLEGALEADLEMPRMMRRARIAPPASAASDGVSDRVTGANASIVRSTHARVFGCFETPPQRVRARVWVDGSTGRVREVDVPSGGRPVEVECVRRAVRSASFPLRDGVARYTTTLEYER